MDLCKYSQEELKYLWSLLEDIPIYENLQHELCIDIPFLSYHIDTPVEEIWHDFDDAIDGGIYQLIYPTSSKNVIYINDEDFEYLEKMLRQ